MFRLAGLLVIVLSGAVLADPPAPSPDSAPASDSTDSTDSTTAPDASTATPKRSSRPKIPLRVVRVDAEREQAILFDKRHDATVTVGLGAMVNGYIVDAIEDDEVTLISPGGTQVVLAAPALAPAPSAAAEPPAAPAAELTGPTNAQPVDPYADATPTTAPDSPALQTRAPDGAPDTTLAVPDTRAPAVPDTATNPVPDMPSGTVPDTATNRVPDMPSAAVPDGDAKVVPDRQPDTQAVESPSAPIERTPDLGSPIADAMSSVVPAASASKTASGATTPAHKSRPARAASHANTTTDAATNAAAATDTAGATNAAADATADASAGDAMTATLSAGDVDTALADFGALMGAVRGTFTPAGARIDALAAGSVFAKAGLRTGDVITAIDGTPVRDLDDAAELYARAATARSITVQLVRDGSPRTLRVAIRR
ncbi:MAG TPA: PDZ domain-containing protein [Kofleriaceae bacterium]|nr:PDZ domain-containing protein [Kofleriaceae bacterium]